MQNNKQITISVGKSRHAQAWNPQTMLWSEFVGRISKPIKTPERLEEYKALPKSKQDEIKDVGGFVGGTLINNMRKNTNVEKRDLITLDADNIAAGATQEIINKVANLGCAYAIYSTKKHEPAAPRLRLIIPLAQSCSAEEYEPIARWIASQIGMGIFDPTTFQPVRLMYWPCISCNSEYVFTYEDKPFLNPLGVLGMYSNWRNIEEWPEVPGAKKLRERSLKKQGNPLEKTGIVGAFCRVYDIPAAIDKFLSEVYWAYGENRYTYLEGSTSGGAVLYENGNFLYSHHATDPASDKLCNAFDLVRIHLFGEEDDTAKPDTPSNRLPSYQKMVDLAMKDKEVSTLISKERYEQSRQEFSCAVEQENEDLDWISKLEVHKKTGIALPTIDNVWIILTYDSLLANKFYHDEFANRAVICDYMPWEIRTPALYKERAWTDTDDAGMRHYLEKAYKITKEKSIYDGMALYATTHKRNKIKEYLTRLKWDNTPRLDTLLIDYFGAADSEYTRLTIRKTLTAAVARVMQPGIKFDTMLILAGQQGVGKSTFFNILGKEWYSDALTTFEGREAAELIQGYWIIEAGELTGFSKSERNTIKSFMSRRTDVYREPYGRKTADFPRRCIIVGTTNDNEFLKDETGNRRFWPIDLGMQERTKSVFEDLEKEVDQIWAEAFVRWQCGERLDLQGSVAEEAKRQQEAHKEVSPKEGIIREFLEKKVPMDWNKRDLRSRREFFHFQHAEMDENQLVSRDRICAAEIWCECFLGDLKLMKKTDAYEINTILGGLGEWEKAKGVLKFGKYYGVQRGYIRKDTLLKI